MQQTKGIRSVAWNNGKIILIDQRKLPNEFVLVECQQLQQVIDAIQSMCVRGAPAIGATGAYGLALAAFHVSNAETNHGQKLLKELELAKTRLDEARPTAVNLAWATSRIITTFRTFLNENNTNLPLKDLQQFVLDEAEKLASEDVDINKRLSQHGATIVPFGSNILHHCNTGALATVDIGTALGVIFECHQQGKNIHVWVDETRPRLQGARLSAWELMREEVPFHLIADNAAGHLMLAGKVDVVLFGADRVAANGDVVNKIGTYKLAVVARENGIPVYACVPTSTIDLDFAEGITIPIEERNAEEVTCVGEERIAPLNCPVYNPAFDVTPYKYITGIITEEGICYPPFSVSLRKAKEAAENKKRMS